METPSHHGLIKFLVFSSQQKEVRTLNDIVGSPLHANVATLPMDALEIATPHHDLTATTIPT